MRVVAWLIALSFLIALPTRAGVAVLFEDGREMQVEALVLVDEDAVLRLEGGGEISVPLWRIETWSEIAEIAPPAAVSEDGVWRRTAGDYADLIELAAGRHGLDPALLTAVAQVESAFKPDAVSPKGAGGLLQLMPATAERFGVEDVFDPAQNVEGGARYLSWLLDRFEGDTELALAGYNAGEGAVERHDGVPPYRETRRYVVRVLDRADRMTRLAP